MAHARLQRLKPAQVTHAFAVAGPCPESREPKTKALAIGFSGEQGFIAKGVDQCEGMFYGMCGVVTEVFS